MPLISGVITGDGGRSQVLLGAVPVGLIAALPAQVNEVGAGKGGVALALMRFAGDDAQFDQVADGRAGGSLTEHFVAA